jgi:hypothetical protein
MVVRLPVEAVGDDANLIIERLARILVRRTTEGTEAKAEQRDLLKKFRRLFLPSVISVSSVV